MPRKQIRNRQAREAAIQAAIAAKKVGIYKTFSRAAAAYSLPTSTVTKRAAGRVSHASAMRSNSLLTEADEAAIVEWIELLNRQGWPPAVNMLPAMALAALRARGIAEPPPNRRKLATAIPSKAPGPQYAVE